MLLRIAGLLGTTLLLIIGVVHVASTAVIFGRPSDSAAWFAGAGLALVFSALLNLIARRHEAHDRFVWWTQQVVNGLTVWIAGFVTSQLPGMLSFVVLSSAILQGTTGFLRLRAAGPE
jgi:hypothetical protein